MESTFPARAPAEEDRLLRRFLSGDAAASRKVERWAWEVSSFGRYRLPYGERADVVQDTVAAVWQAASSSEFALRHSLRAFVRRVAVARCVDRMRRRRPAAALDESIVDPSPGPYDELLRHDESARLRWALQNLDAGCRELIRLHFFEELSYAEIGAREERAEATMRVHMFHCMKAIRKLIARWRG